MPQHQASRRWRTRASLIELHHVYAFASTVATVAIQQPTAAWWCPELGAKGAKGAHEPWPAVWKGAISAQCPWCRRGPAERSGGHLFGRSKKRNGSKQTRGSSGFAASSPYIYSQVEKAMRTRHWLQEVRRIASVRNEPRAQRPFCEKHRNVHPTHLREGRL
jgi:hypothetical protein